MASLHWTHLLAGPLILMQERRGAITKSQLESRGLNVERIANELLRPEWSVWFGTGHGLSRSDLDAELESFLGRREMQSLDAWYDVLLHEKVIEIEWYDRQPWISPHCVGRWEVLANLFDVDALLTFDLARKQLARRLTADLEGLDHWRTLPRVGDHELRQIFSAGLSDLHVHAGGVRIAQGVWCDLMEGRDPRVFRNLVKVYEQRAQSSGTLAGGSNSRSFVKEIACAKANWNNMLAGLGGDQPSLYWRGDRSPTRGAIPWSTWSYERLARERHILTRAWTMIREWGFPRSIGLQSALDAYLTIKHRFFSLARQSAFENTPGLRYFDRNYFGRLRKYAPSWGAIRSSSVEPGPRRQMSEVGNACVFLLESHDLRKVELRMAPFRDIGEYIRYFKHWRVLEGQIRLLINDKVEFRFAVHFKRTRHLVRQGADATPPATARILTELDRETAVLRLALATDNVAHQYAMTALARIDVAGQERDMPLSTFAMHLRLLRGDPEMLRILDDAEAGSIHPCDRFLTHWKTVKRRDKERPSLSQPGLGMTVHAGEDYADVLDGLYQIGVAVDYLGLRAGDSIGHALALRAPLNPSSIAKKTAPLGVEHDSLCWLHALLDEESREKGCTWNLGPLQDMIEQTGNRIYRHFPKDVANAHYNDFIWVWRHKLEPSRRYRNSASIWRQKLLDREYEDDIIGRREQLRRLRDDRSSLNPLVGVAQDILFRKVVRRRIVVEMNPSSNIRISGARRVGESPAVLLCQSVRDGLLATINTDNPGVFSSCIENEYALLLRGMVDEGMREDEARELLERVRKCGLSLLHWPERPRPPEPSSDRERMSSRKDEEQTRRGADVAHGATSRREGN